MSFWIIAIFLMAAMPVGSASDGPPVTKSVNLPTNLPARSTIRPEDLLWSSAQDCLKKAQYKEALPKFTEFARQYRNDALFAEALFYQGLCDVRLGQEVQALSLWDQVLKQEMQKKPKSRAWLLTMEQMTIWYGQKGKEEDRKKALKQLLAECPDDPITVRLHVQAAEARLKASDYAGALGFYRAVEGKLTDTDRKNMDLAAVMATKGAKNPRELLTAANESFEKNNVDQAIKLYQTFLKQNPDSPLAAEARTELGWSLYVQGKWQESEALWQDVIRKGSPKDEWVGQSRWHMIQLLMGPAGKPDKAIELCETQAKAFPNDPRGERALFIRAWLYWTQKQWVKARGAFNDLLAAYPANAVDPPVQGYIRDCEQGIRDVSGGGK
ncbi:MAG: tetratricopeptide repeat protein [Kiritimatiellae bacterium]|nr:tetratricopeptide repeat protein [Verrucomicrobiota bacterium]MBU4292271.1 tetratricopeptide repeat protein [Verrucomicrobiota bacterium]MCG2679292.1 tetratricopeptide repeat protein [Kiritimatiellia bacterium]